MSLLGLNFLTKRKVKVKPFRYQPMYYDEAAEKRQEREARIRAELGMEEGDENLLKAQTQTRLKGAFQSGRKEHNQGKAVNLTVALIVLILCATFYAYAYVGNYALFALTGVYLLYRVKKHQMNKKQEDDRWQ